MNEKRKHKRYNMPRGTFAILRSETDYLDNIDKMSMGEIAIAVYKTEPQKLGQIKNISMGGLSFEYIEGCRNHMDPLELDVLMTEKGIYLHNIPYKTITDEVITDELTLNAVNMKRLTIMFTDLSKHQKTKLRSLITNRIKKYQP